MTSDNIHMGGDENVRGLSFLRDNSRKADNSNDEIVEQILREKSLSPPHESGPNNKMSRSSEDDNNNHMGEDENVRGFSSLRDDLILGKGGRQLIFNVMPTSALNQ